MRHKAPLVLARCTQPQALVQHTLRLPPTSRSPQELPQLLRQVRSEEQICLTTSPPLQAELTVSLRAVARSKATCCRCIKRVWHHGAEQHAGEDPRVKDVHTSNVSSDTKAPNCGRLTRAAEPIAKLFQISTVVISAASSTSARSRTHSSSHDITAMPPALSEMGPKASMVSPIVSVPSIPKAPSATPKMPHK